MFQSTPPHGRRPEYSILAGRQGRVSIHASAREATLWPDHGAGYVCVSIHASAREATRVTQAIEKATSLVSIHASAREATGHQFYYPAPDCGFNPRLRTGGDLRSKFYVQVFRRFNPRLRTGGDMHQAFQAFALSLFQSTPPHGRRRIRPQDCVSSSWFQSTPPHGRRHSAFVIKLKFKLFQSTPPHGRRRAANAASCSSVLSFNPRLRTGGDAHAYLACTVVVLFQSTPPHGRRPAPPLLPGTTAKFQSTPPHGRRPYAGQLSDQPSTVSIHASAREATVSPWQYEWRQAGFNPRLRTGGDCVPLAI